MAKAAVQRLPGSLADHDVARVAAPALDIYLVGAILLLLALGVLMVTTASMPLADRNYGDALYFTRKQIYYVVLGLALALGVTRVSIKVWQKLSPVLLVLGALALILVLVPGLGVHVNGSYRWLDLGIFRLQPSELMKWFLILYIADYVARRHGEVRETFGGFFKPFLVAAVAAGLLLLEPDFGAMVVTLTTVLCMLFIAGARLRYFMGIFLMALAAGVALVLAAPYRLERVTRFLDPWADPFDSGFQLTQALIAFGRGEWFGVGLGNSVQKLLYLPEPHTDFVLAILAEELGLVGLVLVIATFAVLLARMFAIAMEAQRRQDAFSTHAVNGVAIWFGIQVLINIGVNMGVLPTKGLTLPLMSYGGTSVVVMCVAAAFVVRVDMENRMAEQPVRRKGWSL